jgi:hypothetical protein
MQDACDAWGEYTVEARAQRLTGNTTSDYVAILAFFVTSCLPGTVQCVYASTVLATQKFRKYYKGPYLLYRLPNAIYNQINGWMLTLPQGTRAVFCASERCAYVSRDV